MGENTIQTGKHLTFKLGKEEYAISITRVREIIGMMDITNVPQSADYIKGVINLRGSVSPVIDLRLRFNMPAADYTERTCIIIVEAQSARGLTSVGLVVDSVSEVLFVAEDQIDDKVHFGSQSKSSFVTGLAKTASGVKILLDVDRVVNMEAFVQFEKAA